MSSEQLLLKKVMAFGANDNVWLACLLGGVSIILTTILVLRWKKDRAVQCKCKSRVQGKVVIITGGTKGIGYQLACNLAHNGAILYIAGRDCVLGQAVESSLRTTSGNAQVFFRLLDLTSLTSVRTFVKNFLKDESVLDILVNNAGVFYHPSQLTKDGFDVSFQTNYLGPYVLTSELLSQLNSTPSSRLVFLSSEAYKIPAPNELSLLVPTKLLKFDTQWDGIYYYALTKLATFLFAKHLAKKNPEILVSSVNPGSCWSLNNYRHFLATYGWKQYYKQLQFKLFMRTQEDGTQSALHAINAPQYTTGSYISDCESLSVDHVDPNGEATEDLLLRTQLWTKDLDKCGTEELESSCGISNKKND